MRFNLFINKHYIPFLIVVKSVEHLFNTGLWRLSTRAKIDELTIRLQARVFYEQIVNEAQPSWLSLVENKGRIV